jgi:multidrug efflux system membrane fusion protein
MSQPTLSSIRRFRVLALVAACAGCQPRVAVRAEDEKIQHIAVRVAPVERGAIRIPVRAFGTLGAHREVALGFKVGGIVSRVLVEEGQRVHKGQLLAVLDTTEMDAHLDKAHGELEQSRREFARRTALYEDQSTPLALVQDAETAVAVANANKAALEFNRQCATLIAPSAGVVALRGVDVGEIVMPGSVAFILNANGAGPTVKVALIDRDLLSVKLGARARVSLDADPEHPLSARVSQIARVASPLTGTFQVELTVEGSDVARLPSGLSARVEIERAQPSAGTSVPVSALVEANGLQAAVYVLDGSRARRVPVTLRTLTGDRAVLSGLPPEIAEVVDSGASFLHDGALVSVVP